jgi:NitT/TauT family transport system substrate-binding protein
MLFALAAMTVSVSFSACTRTADKPAGPAKKVTIAYATPPHAVLAQVAQARGYYQQEGLEAVPQVYSYGKAALDAVLDGKADFATVAETPVMFAIMKGEKISVIATIQTSNKNNAIFAKRDKGILSPGELKGRKIAATFGTISEFFMDAFLATHGISRKNMKVVSLEPEALQTALVNGDVDAVSTWDPFLIQMQKKLGEKGNTFYGEDLYTQTFNVVATQDFIRGNPDTVKKMLRALIKAEEFVDKNQAEAQELVAEFSKLQTALIREIWPGNRFNVTLDQSLLLALEDESRWAITNRLTKATRVPNYLDFIYTDGLAAVKPEAVRILR